MGRRREDRLVTRPWESFFLVSGCLQRHRRVNPAKKKGLAVTQQSLCMALERGMGWLDSSVWEGGRREEMHVSLLTW